MNHLLTILPAGTPAWTGQLITALLAAAIGVAIALLAHRILYGLLCRVAEASESQADDMVVCSIARPTRWSMVALGLALAARETPYLAELWAKVAGFVMPALAGWIALTIVRAMVQTFEIKSMEAHLDNRETRRTRTRLAIFSRIGSFIIIFITIGLMLLSIPGVREVGVTLMASAGLAGLAVGAAAQPTLKSLIAGLQLAVTEPLRIGDLVVVDGHTGRVEEIRMNFVVVRIWDERAVIVPTIRFLEESFENWSRVNEKLTGPVFLHLDPATAIEPVRQEFLRFIATQDLWDQRSAKVLLTESHPGSIELRLSMSAATIGELFELRCAVREHMIEWLRREMPDALIRHRLDVDAANPRAAKA